MAEEKIKDDKPKGEVLFEDKAQPAPTDKGAVDVTLPEDKTDVKVEPVKDKKDEPKADDKKPDDKKEVVFDDPHKQSMFEDGFIDKDGKPGPNHDKFVKLYAENKDMKRQLAEGIDKSEAMQTVKSMLQTLTDQNAELKNQIESGSAESRLTGLNTRLADITSKQAAAKEDMNFEEYDKLANQAHEVKVEIRDEKLLLEAGPEPAAAPATEAQDKVEFTAAMTAFNADNPWNVKGGPDYNPIKASEAIDIDNNLMKDPKWANVSYAERLKEVSNRMAGNKVDDKGNGKGGAGDAPPSPEGGQTQGAPVAGKTVRLSAVEQELAKGMGVPFEDFAKAKANKGEPV